MRTPVHRARELFAPLLQRERRQALAVVPDNVKDHVAVLRRCVKPLAVVAERAVLTEGRERLRHAVPHHHLAVEDRRFCLRRDARAQHRSHELAIRLREILLVAREPDGAKTTAN
eukprot:5933543-Pleurochrysis_carterae.AAC.1